MSAARSRALLFALATVTATTVAAGSAPASPAISTVVTPSKAGWGRPVPADPSQGDPQTVSCPTLTFCLAVDSWGNAMMFDGTRWTAPTPIVPSGYRSGSFPRGVFASCVSASFCVAVENAGSDPYDIQPSYAQTFDGTDWSTPVEIDQGVASSVSCATTTSCVAVTREGDAVAFDGATWSSPVQVADGATLSGVSCAAADFCMATGYGDGDYAFVYDGSRWSGAAGSDVGDAMDDVSCTSAQSCVAVGGYLAATYDGTTWAKPVKVTFSRATRLGSVTCASSTMCVAVAFKSYLVYDGSTWTAAHRVSWHSLYSEPTSCVTPTWCMSVATQESQAGRTVGGDGYALTFDGAGWSEPVLIERSVGYPSGVSCPTSSFCVSVDVTGHAVTRTGGTWNTPARVESGSELVAVSCASRTFCAAVDNAGRTVTFDGAHWGRPVLVDPAEVPFISVTCATSSWCVAVNSLGQASTFDGATWTTPAPLKPGLVTYSVSCLSSTSCLAVGFKDPSWHALTFDGTSWSWLAGVAQLRPAVFVSCGSTTLCAVVDAAGDAQVYDGTAWGEEQQVDGTGTYVRALSCATLCVAVDAYGRAVTYDAGVWSKPAKIDADGDLRSVSCPASRACVALDADGWAVTRTTSAAG